MLFGKLRDSIEIPKINAVNILHLTKASSCASVSGQDVDYSDAWRLVEFPGQGMFSSAIPKQENVQIFHISETRKVSRTEWSQHNLRRLLLVAAQGIMRTRSLQKDNG